MATPEEQFAKAFAEEAAKRQQGEIDLEAMAKKAIQLLRSPALAKFLPWIMIGSGLTLTVGGILLKVLKTEKKPTSTNQQEPSPSGRTQI
jgi:hypothetical protein